MITATALKNLHDFDKLDPKAKAIFWENDLDYVHMLWFQCTMATSNQLDAAIIYKNNYWRFCQEMDQRDGTN